MDRTDPKANRSSRPSRSDTRTNTQDTSPVDSNDPAADQPIDELCEVTSESPTGEDDGVEELLETLESPTSNESASKQDATTSWQKGTVIDRRVFTDRRAMQQQFGADGTQETGDQQSTDRKSDTFSGLERRRGRGRRLSDFSRSAEEGDMTKEQFLFLVAIDEFKKANDKTFPTWTDVLEVIRLLGYRKTMTSELDLRRAEDWREPAFSPSSVRPPNWAKRKAA